MTSVFSVDIMVADVYFVVVAVMCFLLLLPLLLSTPHWATGDPIIRAIFEKCQNWCRQTLLSSSNNFFLIS